MKFHIVPFAISLAVSCLLLFGGWFLYHSMALSHPFQKIVADIPGVVQAQTDISTDQAKVRLQLAEGASLREIVEKIEQKSTSVLSKRTLEIEVTNPSTASLDKWWASSLFQVTEAMDQRNYGDIPLILKKQSGNVPGLEATAEMDEQHVYVCLSLNHHSKYIILPRQPAVMEGWSHA